MRELPARRPYDSAYTQCHLRFTGTSPLLMSSGEADRQSELFHNYRALSRKRGKTIEDEDRLRELEWYTRLYHDERIGPYVPGRNIKELLRSAATAWREGEKVKRSLVVPDYRIPLDYDGPREAAELWAAGYSYTTMVANAGAGSGRVERTRPCFDEWALDVEIAFDSTELDPSMVEQIVGRTTKYGLGDYRPEFGAFTVEFEVTTVKRGNAKANGSKSRDERAKRAQEAHTARVVA